MKLLIIFHAGATENARQIYHGLAQAGDIELTVIAPESLQTESVYDPTGWLRVKREENGKGYSLFPVPLRNPSNYGRGFKVKSLQRLIKRIQPDIIHVLDEAYSNYLFQVVWQRLIAAPHSKVLFYGFQNLPLRLGWRSLPWKLTWTKMAGGVTANRDAIEVLRGFGFPGHLPLERIFWGISTDTFKPMDSLTLKEQLDLDCEYIMGFVGRLIPEKGIRVLQDTLPLLPHNVHCLIIGSGPLRADLERWSEMPDLRGRVHLRDVMPQDELVRYVNCMDVLVIPSLTLDHWKEQYGRVAAEAMACGVPVVGSNSGAISEVIGAAGLAVQEGNHEGLAEAVHTTIFDRQARERFRQIGLQRAKQELSITAMSGRLLDFYRRV